MSATAFRPKIDPNLTFNPLGRNVCPSSFAATNPVFERKLRREHMSFKHKSNLPSGACQICSKESELIYPHNAKVCFKCATRLMVRNEHINPTKKSVENVEKKTYACDCCGSTRKGYFISINFHSCRKCIGRFVRKGNVKL